MIEHFRPKFLFPRDSVKSLNFPTNHSLLTEHGRTHELKTGDLLIEEVSFEISPKYKLTVRLNLNVSARNLGFKFE